ncbi:hypothetical protein F4823DRAFT_578125 [Ustulina deusta]|nr:hypothetical protein F4823DRAFT_578125 [Ustulina deusta]
MTGRMSHDSPRLHKICLLWSSFATLLPCLLCIRYSTYLGIVYTVPFATCLFPQVRILVVSFTPMQVAAPLIPAQRHDG